MRELKFVEAQPFVNQFKRIVPLVLSVACLCFFTLSTARAQVTTADIVGTATDPSGAALASGSATATSLATGSFNEEELKFLTRIHDKETAIGTVFNAQKEGYKNISVDLIFNLPGQTKEI